MAVSKVIYGNNTLVDLTNDSVSPETLLEGETAHRADGEPIVGAVVVTDAEEIDYEDYQELTPEEQADGSIRFIPDYPSIAGRPGAAAGEVGYDNTQSGLVANKVQGAIDELSSKIGSVDISDVGSSVTGAIHNLSTAPSAYLFYKTVSFPAGVKTDIDFTNDIPNEVRTHMIGLIVGFGYTTNYYNLSIYSIVNDAAKPLAYITNNSPTVDVTNTLRVTVFYNR